MAPLFFRWSAMTTPWVVRVHSGREIRAGRRARLLHGVVFAALLALPVACGSSASTNITGPTATKCQVTLSNGASELPSTGGNGALTVGAERECSWTASTSAAWVALASTSGQGPATIVPLLRSVGHQNNR